MRVRVNKFRRPAAAKKYSPWNFWNEKHGAGGAILWRTGLSLRRTLRTSQGNAVRWTIHCGSLESEGLDLNPALPRAETTGRSRKVAAPRLPRLWNGDNAKSLKGIRRQYPGWVSSLYEVPTAAVTKHHSLGGFKQQEFLVLRFGD